MVDEATHTAHAELDQLERDSSMWSGTRPRIGLGAAAVLAVGASAATAIYVRRRAQARVDRVTWLAMRASALGDAIPGGRRVAPFGGAGGAVLLAAMLLARARRAPEPGPLDELSHRVAQLQARADTQALLDRPRGRDLLLGAAMGLGVAGLLGRRAVSRAAD